MDIIWEAIYEKADELPENNPVINEKYFRYKNQLDQFYNLLRDNLAGDNLKTLERLISKQEQFNKVETMRFFINGFKLGMSLAIESLN